MRQQMLLGMLVVPLLGGVAHAAPGDEECEAIRSVSAQRYAWCLAGMGNIAKCNMLRSPDNEKLWCKAVAGKDYCGSATDPNDEAACDAIRRGSTSMCRGIGSDKEAHDEKWFCLALVEADLGNCTKLASGRSEDAMSKKTNCEDAVQGIKYGREFQPPEEEITCTTGCMGALGKKFKESLRWTGLFSDEAEKKRHERQANTFWERQEEELARKREAAQARWARLGDTFVQNPRRFGRLLEPDELLPESIGGLGPALPPGVPQRRYSRVEYAELWAKHQGHEMTELQKRTLRRGCIGITALNLTGGGNPMNAAEAIFSDFDAAKRYLDEANQLLSWLQDDRNPATDWLVPGGKYPENWRYVMFGKLYWSNQESNYRNLGGVEPDPDAFPSDEHGEMDLENFLRNYDYKARPKVDENGEVTGGYINFDYAFYDEAQNEFWHANHMEYDDPEKQKKSPMRVLQSTPAKFAKSYTDFDRVLYAIALAKAYDVKTTANFWIKK